RLLWPAPAVDTTFLGYRFVEGRHSAARALQPCPQRLERSTFVFLQCCKPLQGVRCEGRAWIDRGPLDESFQRIADVLGGINGGGDEVLGFFSLAAVHCATSSIGDVRPMSRSLKSIP